MERFETGRFSIRIPGTQGIETKFFLFMLVDEFHQRKDVLLYGIVKSETVLFRIVKATHFHEFVVAVIGKAGVYANFISFLNQFGE